MADSFDRTTSTLLCSEDSDTGVADFECNAADDSEISRSLNHQNAGSNWGGFESVLGFPLQSEETLRLLAERERVYMPKDDYLVRLRSGDLDLSVRREALDWIWKVHNYYGFGPLSLCLSINYFDRFLSMYDLPRSHKWTGQLLAVACLSIATKVEETKMPQLIEFQVEGANFLFEARTIQRMELLLLNTLQWKMHAFTPCSFIDNFLAKIPYHQHTDTFKSSISRSIQLILSITRGVDFLEFRPSEIAAAVAISVSRELQSTELDKAITCFLIVQKERVLKCVELIRDLFLVSVSSANLGRNSGAFLPQSPMGVLDAASLSYKSEELTDGSWPNSSHDSPNAKRNKSGKSEDTSKS
ncbi:cyclin-D4-2-like [Neltuma alba]|uniref:cyclin-D4-2-like n=1 Tax=Neltuma alba TaxID=207710 RepID=UPI0010A56728|nr:cyclin-D4-2-like [Prosopis alba]XP_028754518.1 cyclin-D4-2-like [Prosopis alba]